MSHYLILKIFSRKVKILIVIINLSPFGVYVLFFVCVSVCIVFFWWGGGAGGIFICVVRVVSQLSHFSSFYSNCAHIFEFEC